MLGWHDNGCSVVVTAECVWVVVVLECPETSPPGPKTMVLLSSLGLSELSCMFVIEVLYNLGQQGSGREGISNQVFQWNVEGIH